MRIERTFLAALLVSVAPWLAGCGSSPSDGPFADRLPGSWRLVKTCVYERIDTGPPCEPVNGATEALRFGTDGTASEPRPGGPSGRYAIERRPLPNGGEEVLLDIDGRNMGQLSFVGDTLVLGMSYVDGADRYFLRLPD